MKTQKIVILAATSGRGNTKQRCKEGPSFARGPAVQLQCWVPLEAWPVEVKCIRIHYSSLPGQPRPQAGDSWQSMQGTGKDEEAQGDGEGLGLLGFPSEYKSRLRNLECSHSQGDWVWRIRTNKGHKAVLGSLGNADSMLDNV